MPPNKIIIDTDPVSGVRGWMVECINVYVCAWVGC